MPARPGKKERALLRERDAAEGITRDTTKPPKRKREVEAPAERPPKKPKRRKKDKEEAALTEDEKWRRDMQKQLRDTIVELQKKGASAEEIKTVKNKFRMDSGMGRKMTRDRKRDRKQEETRERRKEERKKEREDLAKKKERRTELGSKHDVVIVPIYWKNHAGEKEVVEAACDRLKKRLMEKKLDAWVDWRTVYTPGQKFAYWEHLGVHRRVEVGPKELSEKKCVLAQSKVAGEVATKVTVSLNGRALLDKLKDWGLEKLEVTEDDEDYEDGDDADTQGNDGSVTKSGDADTENFVLKSDKKESKTEQKAFKRFKKRKF